MGIRDEISDYEENKTDIEKWLHVKGEEKYTAFLNMLKDKGIRTTWANVSGLYRYDKRLLINNFKYLSFFEEYCRARLIREGRLPYDKVQPLTFGRLIDKMIESGISGDVFGITEPGRELENVRALRNWVSHNRIMLEMGNCGYPAAVQSLHNLLPEDYREGYTKDLKGCSKKIDVSKEFEQIPH